MQTVFAQLYYSGFSEYVNSFSEIRKFGTAFLCNVSAASSFADRRCPPSPVFTVFAGGGGRAARSGGRVCTVCVGGNIRTSRAMCRA